MLLTKIYSVLPTRINSFARSLYKYYVTPITDAFYDSVHNEQHLFVFKDGSGFGFVLLT